MKWVLFSAEGSLWRKCGCGVPEDELEAQAGRALPAVSVLGSAALCLAFAPSNDASTS